jgi:hypothetical protein
MKEAPGGDMVVYGTSVLVGEPDLLAVLTTKQRWLLGGVVRAIL